MALVYVGGTSGSGTGASYNISLSGTLTGGIASSPAPGDIVVVASGFGNNASSAPTCSGDQSGTYTGLFNALHVNDTWDTEFRAFYSLMGSTPDTSLTIGRVSNGAYGGATVVHVWRGVDATTPFDVATVTATSANASRPNPPAITPVTAGAVVIACGAGMQTTAGGAFTIPSGMSNGVSAHSNGTTSDIGTFIASFAWVSGAYDPAAVTGGTTSTSGSWAAATLVLRPGALTQDSGGSVVVSGAVTRTTLKTIGGSMAPAGSTAKAAHRATTGAITPSGVAAKATMLGTPFAGSTAPSGSPAVSLLLSAPVSGVVTLSGSVARLTARGLVGVIATIGTVVKASQRYVAGTLTLAALRHRAVSRLFGRTLTPTGESQLALRIIKGASGTLTPSGATSHQTQSPAPDALLQPAILTFMRRYIGRR